MAVTMKNQILVLTVEELLGVEVGVEEAVAVEVEEVTVTEERDEIVAIVETAIVIETGIGIVTVTGTVTARGEMKEKVQVTAAITAIPHSNRTNHHSSHWLHQTAVTQFQACSHPTAYHLHPWVVHQTTCGEA
jgi:NAD/NADP transhydrogenase beta subunit